MDRTEAQILLENLLERITADRKHQVTGAITDREMSAIRLAAEVLVDNWTPPPGPAASARTKPQHVGEAVEEPETTHPTKPTSTQISLAGDEEELVEIDETVLELPPPQPDVRLCLDFGTAMSKATLVYDETDTESEKIIVLPLGAPGGEREGGENMLTSTVYIDNKGILWFGQEAVEISVEEGRDGSRQRLDNIKRWVSEDDIDVVVDEVFNPTEVKVTYSDMVLAYLTFMTWCVNQALEESGFQRNTLRRFAIPCFSGERARTIPRRLAVMLGESQVLADTYFQTLPNGIPLEHFMRRVAALRKERREYNFVAENITEPLGVASSHISWYRHVNTLALVIDVGAGTTDFSLFKIQYDPETKKSRSAEIEGSARCVPEAGNHLDGLLTDYILKKAGVDYDNPQYQNFLGALNLRIREDKETLFEEGFVTSTLFNSEIVEVTLDEFLALESVSEFSDVLRDTVNDILKSIDKSWLKSAPHGAIGVAVTGGGAKLPMVQELATGVANVQGVSIKLVPPKTTFPEWMAEDEELMLLEEDYPRIAVSLGGARKQIINPVGTFRITAGDVVGKPTIGGYYTKGR